MSRRHFLSKIDILATALVLALSAVLPARAQIPPGERQVLIDIYMSTSGAAWTNNALWCEGPCPASGAPTFNATGTECSWGGVECVVDADSYHVFSIVLRKNNLAGTLPAISSLSHLYRFDVGDNDLTGQLPSLAGMAQLAYFNADHNRFSGTIPPFGSMPSLYVYDVQDNRLSGAIPALGGLPSIGAIYAAYNLLNGAMPALSGLATLQGLDVGHNAIAGTMPALTGLPNLAWLYFEDNRLEGTIPNLSQLSSLRLVDFSHNRLTGKVPAVADPPVLTYRGSKLCPNPLDTTPSANDLVWDMATLELWDVDGLVPWWAAPYSTNRCDDFFTDTFD